MMGKREIDPDPPGAVSYAKYNEACEAVDRAVRAYNGMCGQAEEARAELATLREQLNAAREALRELLEYDPQMPMARKVLPGGGYCRMCEAEWQGTEYHAPPCPVPRARAALNTGGDDG